MSRDQVLHVENTVHKIIRQTRIYRFNDFAHCSKWYIRKSIAPKLGWNIIVVEAISHQPSPAISFEFRCDETINIKLYYTFVVNILEARTMMIAV